MEILGNQLHPRDRMFPNNVIILGNQLHPTDRMFPNNVIIFQGHKSLKHTARSVQSWFKKHEVTLQHLPWPAQSPDLEVIETLWSVLESRVSSKITPPSSLKQL
jgi:hypothetical protein